MSKGTSILAAALGFSSLLACSKPQDEARLTILEPKEGEVLPGNTVTMKFKLQGFLIREGGEHLHVILDDQPYRAHYDAAAPVYFENVPPGPHVIRAFPTRSNCESLKNPEAFALVNFSVGAAAPPIIDPTKPIFTYSRPQGTYKGALSDRILFDFWIKNVTLSPEGYKVRYTLDGVENMLTEWKPLWFEDARRIGTHTLTVELLDAEARVVTGNPFTRVEREFLVIE